MRTAARVVVALALLAGACSSGSTSGEPPATSSTTAAQEIATTAAADLGAGVCDEAPLPVTGEGPQREPHHAISDALSVDEGPAHIAARFTHGRLRADLEDAAVEVLVDDCSPRLRSLGVISTDDDGVLETALSGIALPAGRYALRAVVVDDGTSASAVLTVVPSGTDVTVFDIDGTLTVGDRELVEELSGMSDAEARSGAAEATRRHAEAGRLVVYLTGRAVGLDDVTRDWLEAQGMAPGVLRLMARNENVAPTDAGVGAAKLVELERLTAAGLRILDAYGNASTDITAYVGAGIPPERIHMMGPERPGFDNLGEGFEAHNKAYP